MERDINDFSKERKCISAGSIESNLTANKAYILERVADHFAGQDVFRARMIRDQILNVLNDPQNATLKNFDKSVLSNNDLRFISRMYRSIDKLETVVEPVNHVHLVSAVKALSLVDGFVGDMRLVEELLDIMVPRRHALPAGPLLVLHLEEPMGQLLEPKTISQPPCEWRMKLFNVTWDELSEGNRFKTLTSVFENCANAEVKTVRPPLFDEFLIELQTILIPRAHDVARFSYRTYEDQFYAIDYSKVTKNPKYDLPYIKYHQLLQHFTDMGNILSRDVSEKMAANKANYDNLLKECEKRVTYGETKLLQRVDRLLKNAAKNQEQLEAAKLAHEKSEEARRLYYKEHSQDASIQFRPKAKYSTDTYDSCPEKKAFNSLSAENMGRYAQKIVSIFEKSEGTGSKPTINEASLKNIFGNRLEASRSGDAKNNISDAYYIYKLLRRVVFSASDVWDKKMETGGEINPLNIDLAAHEFSFMPIQAVHAMLRDSEKRRRLEGEVDSQYWSPIVIKDGEKELNDYRDDCERYTEVGELLARKGRFKDALAKVRAHCLPNTLDIAVNSLKVIAEGLFYRQTDIISDPTENIMISIFLQIAIAWGPEGASDWDFLALLNEAFNILDILTISNDSNVIPSPPFERAQFDYLIPNFRTSQLKNSINISHYYSKEYKEHLKKAHEHAKEIKPAHNLRVSGSARTNLKLKKNNWILWKATNRYYNGLRASSDLEPVNNSPDRKLANGFLQEWYNRFRLEGSGKSRPAELLRKYLEMVTLTPEDRILIDNIMDPFLPKDSSETTQEQDKDIMKSLVNLNDEDSHQNISAGGS